MTGRERTLTLTPLATVHRQPPTEPTVETLVPEWVGWKFFVDGRKYGSFVPLKAHERPFAREIGEMLAATHRLKVVVANHGNQDPDLTETVLPPQIAVGSSWHGPEHEWTEHEIAAREQWPFEVSP
jgi:hypothetical protein